MTTLGQANSESQFHGIVEIAGLPDLQQAAANGTLMGNRLLEVRASEECTAFREWLAKAEDLPDDAIRKLTSGFAVQTSRLLHSPTGKILRFVAATATGFLSQEAGLAAGAFDTFILDKLIRRRGPLAFLDEKYRSIFQDEPVE